MLNLTPDKVEANEWGTCWIAPSGAFYEVEEANHYWVAIHRLGADSYDLELNGWLHFSFGAAYRSKKLTQAQIDVLFDFIADGEKNKHSWVNRAWAALRDIVDSNESSRRNTDSFSEEY